MQLTLENNIVARTTRRREALEDKLPKGALSKLNEYELAAIRLAFASGRVTTKELAGEIHKGSTLCSKVLRGLVKKAISNGMAPLQTTLASIIL